MVRYLRSRVGPKHSTVTYGSHVALHLSLGLLFLGGGHLTLSTKPEAIAAMICAFYPKFPTHSNDNRSVSGLHTSCIINKHSCFTFLSNGKMPPVSGNTLACAYSRTFFVFSSTFPISYFVVLLPRG